MTYSPFKDNRGYLVPTIRFVKNIEAFAVKSGENLMAALNAHGVPVASSCKGDGICSRCRLKVVDGIKNLSEINAREQMLRTTHSLQKNERISCQSTVLGDITVDAPYW